METTQGILTYAELAPQLSNRVRVAESDIAVGLYESRTLDEELLRELHRAVCGDLVPEWAGRWREVEVRVGNLTPPLPHLVPVLMRDYVRDLEARGAAALAGDFSLTLKTGLSVES